jgi:GH24 family phage-related lysozyme (muramidase)
VIDTILRDQIARDECPGGKAVLEAYLDSMGLWTIGVGHLLHAAVLAPSERPRVEQITQRESDAWFMMDMEQAIADLTSVLGPTRIAKLDAPRWRAAVNMSFNRGYKRMSESTTITPAIKAAIDQTGSWCAVKAAILASPWAVCIKAGRAGRLAQQFETGRDV